MKKVLLASLLSLSFCFGVSLDTSKIEAYWIGYKFTNKTPVKGTFNDMKFKFSNGDDIRTQLLGATAMADVSKVSTGNPVSEENLTLGFFQKFNGKDIKVKIEQVIEGENQGTILAKITMNKKMQLIPMQYELKDNQLVAKGVIDVLSFKLDAALESIAQVCKDLHEGYTWSQVEIGFVVPLK